MAGNDPNESLTRFATAKLDELDAKALRRRLVETERHGNSQARRGDAELISFCCNDYLNLSHHPEVKQAAADAALRYGTGAGGSRLITGNHPLLRDLERALADLKQAEDCMVFGSGYLANLGIIPTLMREGDVIFADELSHACLMAGGQLSPARLHVFRHNDLAHLETLIQRHRAQAANALAITDGVFSMDGDLAPLPEMAALCRAHDVWLMADDAHGIGVVGGGRGSSFAFGDKVDVPLQMGTLSKAVGGYGGYLCAAKPVIDLLRTRARTFVYSTGLPPASAAAALKAVEIIARDPDLVAEPVRKARLFCAELNLPAAESPIVPLILGDARATLSASERLLEAGYLVTAIRPPTVPAGTARLRFTFSAAHDDEDVLKLARFVRQTLLNEMAAQ